MIALPEKEICTGCFACAAACPKDAIEMRADDFGFFCPVIQEDICISCGRCTSVCPKIKKPDIGDTTSFFAAYCNDNEIRKGSTSGGIFGVLAEHIVHQGGTVYGASYDDSFRVHHVRITKTEDLPKLQNAKYAQSDLENTLRLVREDLRCGLNVLFSGTPCQIAGLNNYIGANKGGLITVDLVCHSVPSPAAWNRYIEYRQKQDEQCSAPSDINQRSKKTGWVNYTYSSRFAYPNGYESLVPAGQDAFMKAFTEDMITNPACAYCPAKGIHRSSDITLGDFWGIEKLNLDIDAFDGVSAVMVHSHQGIKLWDSVQDKITAITVTEDQILFQNPAIVTPSRQNENQGRSLQAICRDGFGSIQLLTRQRNNTPNPVKRVARAIQNVLDFVRERRWI